MVLEDGTYTLTNAAHPTSQATLVGGHPLGRIVGLSSASPQTWIVTNNGAVTTVKSGIPGITSFVHVTTAIQGVSLTGSHDTFSWVVQSVPRSPGRYYFTIPEKNLAWTLTSGNREAPINIERVTAGFNIPAAAQWIASPQS